jgi:hypothetical protein
MAGLVPAMLRFAALFSVRRIVSRHDGAERRGVHAVFMWRLIYSDASTAHAVVHFTAGAQVFG